MSNELQKSCEPIQLVAPSGGVVSNTPKIIGGLFVIPASTVAAGETFAAITEVVIRLPKNTSTAFALGAPLYWDVADGEFNADDTDPNLCAGHAVVAAAEADTHVIARLTDLPLASVSSLATRMDAAEAKIDNGGTLEVRVDALENVNGIVFSDSNVGVGDQVNLTDTAAHVFTEKCSVGAAFMVADDILNIDWSVYVDGSDSTPEVTVEVLVGSTVVDTAVIATAAADDYAAGRTRIKCTAVGGSITGEVKSTQILKDGTVTTPGSIQTAKAITASSTAGFDVTVRATSDAGHASNLCTLREVGINIERASA